jgi:hypothetical protein
MKYAGSIALRNPSFGEQASVPEIRRKSFFERMVAGLHRSRRRQARQLVRRYRYLIAEESLCQSASGFPEFTNETEGNRNANGDRTSVRANHRAGPDA